MLDSESLQLQAESEEPSDSEDIIEQSSVVQTVIMRKNKPMKMVLQEKL